MIIHAKRDGTFISKEPTGAGPIDYTAAVEYLAAIMFKNEPNKDSNSKSKKKKAS